MIELPEEGVQLASAQSQPGQDLLNEALLRFGHTSFRPGQREAIETLLDDGRLLLVAPTGGGKSLTYQLPAAVIGGTTLVLSPLIALMEDQVAQLQALGFNATFLASTLDSETARERTVKFARGEYDFVYVAPERLQYSGFLRAVFEAPIELLAIDEAHCISEWGHDFRPEYLKIGEFIDRLKPKRVLACTATATPIVRDEIVLRLGLGEDTPQQIRGFARPNLSLQVVDGEGSKARQAKIDGLLKTALGNPIRPKGTAIIYTPTRKSAEDEAQKLRGAGWRTGAYHAGLSPDERERVSKAFREGDVDIVAATCAFGMGIDRSDVRAVIHIAPPGSIEAYYQEVGRAGRDGAEAFGLLMVSTKDLAVRRRLLERETDGRVPDPALIEHRWSQFLELIRWSEGGSCRHDAILRYFGDEAESLDGCGRCDVCLSLFEADGRQESEIETCVLKALSGVARVHDKLGLKAAAELLVGKTTPKLTQYGLVNSKTFGVLQTETLDWTLKLLRRCVTAGWVSFSTGDLPLAVLTYAGAEVLRRNRPARLVLPPRRLSGGRKSADGPKAGTRSGRTGRSEALFEKLRTTRRELAKAAGVPPYIIATDRTLWDMVDLEPCDPSGLKLVHGMGDNKIRRFGDDFLDTIDRFNAA